MFSFAAGSGGAMNQRRRRDASCARNQARNAARHLLTDKILSPLYDAHTIGRHLWLELPTYWKHEFLTHALRDLVVIVQGWNSFAVGRHYPVCLRVSLVGAVNQPGLGRAFHKIEKFLKHERRSHYRTFG